MPPPATPSLAGTTAAVSRSTSDQMVDTAAVPTLASSADAPAPGTDSNTDTKPADDTDPFGGK